MRAEVMMSKTYIRVMISILGDCLETETGASSLRVILAKPSGYFYHVAIMRKPDIILMLATAAVLVQHATSLRVGSSLHGLELNPPRQLCL